MDNALRWSLAEAFVASYGARLALEAETLSEVLRLREAATNFWWRGRALAKGRISEFVASMKRTAEFARWLERYHSRLEDVAARLSAGHSDRV